LDICHLELLRPGDEWSRREIRKETSVPGLERHHNRFFYWFRILYDLDWLAGEPINRELGTRALRNSGGRRRRGSVPYRNFSFLTRSYFVHQRGLRFALWILAIAVSSSVSAIVSGFIIPSMGWPMTFKICNHSPKYWDTRG
jgi:hypothetical protein